MLNLLHTKAELSRAVLAVPTRLPKRPRLVTPLALQRLAVIVKFRLALRLKVDSAIIYMPLSSCGRTPTKRTSVHVPSNARACMSYCRSSRVPGLGNQDGADLDRTYAPDTLVVGSGLTASSSLS